MRLAKYGQFEWLTWEMRLGIALIALALVFFAIKVSVFGKPAETYDYLLNALVFLPIDVFLVTLILNQSCYAPPPPPAPSP